MCFDVFTFSSAVHYYVFDLMISQRMQHLQHLDEGLVSKPLTTLCPINECWPLDCLVDTEEHVDLIHCEDRVLMHKLYFGIEVKKSEAFQCNSIIINSCRSESSN